MKKAAAILLAAVLLAGCQGAPASSSSSVSAESSVSQSTRVPQEDSWESITPEEAKKMMDEDENVLVVDVRTQEEYDSGHIPGAVLVINEEIGSEPPSQLPDKDQTLLLYCRSGRRSKEAAGKLAELGYTQVYEFGGIQDWPYEVTK